MPSTLNFFFSFLVVVVCVCVCWGGQLKDMVRASALLKLEQAGVLSPSPSPSEKLYFIYKL